MIDEQALNALIKDAQFRQEDNREVTPEMGLELLEALVELRREALYVEGNRFDFDRLKGQHARLGNALKNMKNWAIGSDCYKHFPDHMLKEARQALIESHVDE